MQVNFLNSGRQAGARQSQRAAALRFHTGHSDPTLWRVQARGAVCGLFSCPPGAVNVARADSGSHSSGCGALRQGQSLLPTQPAQSAVSGCRGRRSRRRFQTRAAHRSQAGKSPGTSSVQPVPRWPRRGVGVCISERLLVIATAAGTQSHPSSTDADRVFQSANGGL